MRKIWRHKLFQGIVFILIASSLGIVTSRLETLQFLFENGHLAIENDIAIHLIEDIKIVRIVVITLWALVIGLYLNFIYSINSQITKKTNAQI